MVKNNKPNQRPAQPQATSNQPMMQPQAPYMGGSQYPYQTQPQPAMMRPKQAMDPAKKKKIIMIVSICAGVLTLGIVAAIVIPSLLRIDYAPSYAAAKELKPIIYDIYNSYDCGYVISYIESSYTTTKKYSEYIDNCKKVYSSSVDEAVTKLENTDGVKRNNEIKSQFDKFKSEYTALTSGETDALEAKLDLWQARHNFVVAVDGLKTSSSDAEYAAAAKYLIDSGNEALKKYGEGWLERRTAINAAYRAWQGSSYSAPNHSQLREDYYNKKNEYNDWVATNKPDINTIAPLDFDSTSKMYSEFTKLYDLITKTYQLNYNFGSGDCDEILGDVYCD